MTRDQAKTVPVSKLAAEIGCHRWTVYRACRRLKLDPSKVGRREAALLRNAITPRGRGHWPAGRRRNAQPPPAGWPSIDRFLEDVLDYCTARYGRKKELADYLGVNPKTLHTQLTGHKWPSRPRLLAIARWYRAKRTRGAQ